jgi:hypothetical protein
MAIPVSVAESPSSVDRIRILPKGRRRYLRPVDARRLRVRATGNFPSAGRNWQSDGCHNLKLRFKRRTITVLVKARRSSPPTPSTRAAWLV